LLLLPLNGVSERINVGSDSIFAMGTGDGGD
jgi:hypothetical protein